VDHNDAVDFGTKKTDLKKETLIPGTLKIGPCLPLNNDKTKQN
jgi:hypothetical protein